MRRSVGRAALLDVGEVGEDRTVLCDRVRSMTLTRRAKKREEEPQYLEVICLCRLLPFLAKHFLHGTVSQSVVAIFREELLEK